jgi:hypothetical protein
MMLPLAQVVTNASGFSYTATPFGILAAGAFLGFGLSFVWHCVIFTCSPLKWFQEFMK